MAPAPPMSPQKRVTRARAAAKKAGDVSETTNTKVAPKSSTRKRGEGIEENSAESDMPVINEPLRKSARRVATAAPARRLKITPLNGMTSSQEPPQEENNPSRIPPKPRATRSKKATTDTANLDGRETHTEVAKPKRQTSGVAKAKDTAKTTAPRLRGRPKKADVAQDEVMVEGENTKKQGRARTGSAATTTRALVIAPSNTGVPKKKVTFQDAPDCDKENQPVLQARGTTKAKLAAPASGIKAKPVRRPAATARANAKQGTARATAEAAAQRVLTPKKVTQVAKPSSPIDSDEDELNGAKTPIRDLSQSPRRNLNIARTGSPIKKLDFGSESLASSPVKSQVTSTLLSPAKRPPSSSSKEAFKESPKRVDISFKLPQFPKSNEVGNARYATSSSTMLLQSPKRVALEPSLFPQSMTKAVKSPFKASLLQSPPKRPISPAKASSTIKATEDRPAAHKEFDVDTLSPDVTVCSHFRTFQSPERSSRVHTVTPEELVEEARCAIDFDESIVDIRSPLKLEKQTTAASGHLHEDFKDNQGVEGDFKGDCLMAKVETGSHAQGEKPAIAADGSTAQSEEHDGVATTAPANIMPRDQTPVNASSFLFRASGPSDDDESSEDELQSSVRMFQAQTPVTRFKNKSHLSMASRAVVEQNPGFTPLAAQLSGWLASSPDKLPMKRSQSRGIFSPVAAQHVRGEVIIDRHSPATSRVSLEPRLSTSGRQSVGRKKSLGQKSSSSLSMTGSPDRSTYFADEMAVKDLEEAIESMQAGDQDCDLLQDATSAETINNALVDNDAPLQVAEETRFIQSQREDDSEEPPGQNKENEFGNAPDEVPRDFSAELDAGTLPQEEENRQQLPGTSQESTFSSAYGDENNDPTTPAEVVQEQVLANTQQSTTTTAVVMSSSNWAPLNEFTTPLRPQRTMPRFANTVVSKVPLRPEGNISPIKVSKKRSRSLSAGPSSVKKTPVSHAARIPCSGTVNTISPPHNQVNPPPSGMTSPGQQRFAIDDFGDSTLDGIEIDEDDENLPPVTPTVASFRSFAVTPSKTPKAHTPAAPCGVLQGVVVFVDVHTTEGADASGIFVELLAQMGAKCVKNWPWNPRASMGVNVEESAATPGAGIGSGKIGITHVVYKDGGKRTLEKVRDTGGLVKCVGVGWVLE